MMHNNSGNHTDQLEAMRQIHERELAIKEQQFQQQQAMKHRGHHIKMVNMQETHQQQNAAKLQAHHIMMAAKHALVTMNGITNV